MSSDDLARAEEAKKDYCWTKRLVTKVYSTPRSESRRKVAADLFVGEWTKKLGEAGEELHIRFRGGEGYLLPDDVGNERVLEIYFIDVGQGDAILIQTANDERVLIDGGKDKSAYSFLRWKYNLKKYHKIFDAVIMTHGDADHAAGLIPVLNDDRVITKAVYHNGIAVRKDDSLGETTHDEGGETLVDLYNDVEDLKPKYDQLSKIYQDWVDAVTKAKERAEKFDVDFRCCRVDQNTEKIVIGEANGLQITFLGPINLGDRNSPCLKTFGSASKTINGNSVAVMLEYGQAKILLCGDMNESAENLFLSRWPEERLQAHVFKANHHGSQDFTTDFLRAVKPWASVVSSGDYPDYGHPRANLLGSLRHYAQPEIDKPLLFSTEIAATFKKIPDSKLEAKGTQLYEKTIHGMINIRTNGNWLAAGRVYGKTDGKTSEGVSARGLWKWEAYAFNLANGKPLRNDLLTS